MCVERFCLCLGFSFLCGVICFPVVCVFLCDWNMCCVCGVFVGVVFVCVLCFVCDVCACYVFVCVLYVMYICVWYMFFCV